MERSLALMCGAGGLPVHMATEARRQGWRVVAFAFAPTTDLAGRADVIVSSRLTEVAPVLERIAREGVSAVLFSGKFWTRDFLVAEEADVDGAALTLYHRAQSRADARLGEAVIAMLGAMGLELLDQRGFVPDFRPEPGCWSARAPSPAHRTDLRLALDTARAMAGRGIGQTVVVKDGVVAAVEAAEGTSETVRRGTALAGAGAVVVKTAATDHDYRLDLPVIGPETVEVAARGGAAVLALDAARVALIDREESVRRADAAGMALTAVTGDGEDG